MSEKLQGGHLCSRWSVELSVTWSAKEVSCLAFQLGTWRSSSLFGGRICMASFLASALCFFGKTFCVISLPVTRPLSPHMCNAWRNIRQSYHKVVHVTSRQSSCSNFRVHVIRRPSSPDCILEDSTIRTDKLMFPFRAHGTVLRHVPLFADASEIFVLKARW